MSARTEEFLTRGMDGKLISTEIRTDNCYVLRSNNNKFNRKEEESYWTDEVNGIVKNILVWSFDNLLP